MHKRYAALTLAGLALTVSTATVGAQDTGTNTVRFNDFTFSYPTALNVQVGILQRPADNTELQFPGGPSPAATVITLDGDIFNAGFQESTDHRITLYNTADFAAYAPFAETQTALQGILDNQTDFSEYTGAAADGSIPTLPYLPLANATQVLRAQPQYITVNDLSGIAYITAYSQDVSPFGSRSLHYTFQGLTEDRSRYVAADFTLTNTLFADEVLEGAAYDTFAEGYDDYLIDAVAQIIAAPSDAFTPSLDAVQGIINSFTFDGSADVVLPTPGLVTSATPAPTVTAVTDAALGGLGNNIVWALTSYGDPAAPTPIVAGTQPTLQFTGTGVGGNGSCNSFFGNFAYEGSTLTFNGIGSTLIACETSIQNQETAYFNALSTAQTFTLGQGTLQIAYDGGVLNFVDAALALTPAPGAEATPEATESV